MAHCDLDRSLQPLGTGSGIKEAVKVVWRRLLHENVEDITQRDDGDWSVGAWLDNKDAMDASGRQLLFVFCHTDNAMRTKLCEQHDITLRPTRFTTCLNDMSKGVRCLYSDARAADVNVTLVGVH